MPLVPKSLSEQLLYATTMLAVELDDGTTSTGTGFFFRYPLDEERHLPVLITNNHVIRGGVKGLFHLHNGVNTETGMKPIGNFFQVSMDDFEQQWISHPDETIDLCGIPLQPLIELARENDQQIYKVDLGTDLIWDDERLHELKAVEDVLMIGYPIGLWDHANNFPLIRRGVTASHPSVDFQGKSQTVVDVACFPGSSGSPVLIVNEGMYGTKTGTTVGNRGILVGVLFAGPQTTTDGEIVIEEIPTNQVPVSKTAMMIHLGYIVKAKEILILCKHMVSELRRKGAQI